MTTRLLALTVALATIGFVAAANAESPISTLEFRLAVTEPTDGYEKHTEPTKEDPIYVSDDAVVTGVDIEKVSFFNDPNGHPAVGFVLTDDGSERFWNATSQNTGKKVAVLLDGKVISAPRINQGIKKEGTITGNFDDDDLLRFFTAIVLRKSRDPENSQVGE